MFFSLDCLVFLGCLLLYLVYTLFPVPGVLMYSMQMCWELNLLSIQVSSAPAIPIANLLLSLLVLTHPDDPIHVPFGEVLMLLLQTSAILKDKMKLKFWFASLLN